MRWVTAFALIVMAALTACGDGGDRVVLYTSVTQDTVDAVLEGLAEAEPGLEVQVFRAPTGELAARIAAEQRSGGVAADVLWLTEPLSMYRYRDQGILRVWDPEGAGRLPPEVVEGSFWGTRVLHMVAVVALDVPVEVRSWSDLADPALRVVVPDPGFAGSALAALGFAAQQPDLGIEFYARLFENGGGEVPSPGDVVTAVAEGRYDAGITLDYSARQAAEAGSPIEIVWPDPGAVAFASPIAAVEGSGEGAERLVEYVLSADGQQRIASTGWFPALPGIPGPERPPGAGEVFPDWESIAEGEAALLEAYDSLTGG